MISSLCPGVKGRISLVHSYVTFFGGRKKQKRQINTSFNQLIPVMDNLELFIVIMFPSKNKNHDSCKYIVTFNENLFERKQITNS
jgi:hypothetical protein